MSSNSSDNILSQSYLHEYFDCDYGLKIDLPEAITVYNTDTLFTANNYFEEYKWNTGNNTSTINLNSDGIYYLTVKDKNGCLSMDSMYVEILNKNDITSNNLIQNNFEVQVFPNPAVDNININVINLDIKNDCQIFLFSENGSIVYYKQYSTYTINHDYTINSNFANGSYVLKIINGKNSFSKKIIILK
ncbi:MAG: T9SS type A sorting domain-containing protein [Bacteroidales bacterium]|nr:T9SS type A sorting domain-containing protein [Bacteroidales bacterium]